MRAVLQIIEVGIHVVFHFQNVVFVMVAPEGMVILRPICRACMKSAVSTEHIIVRESSFNAILRCRRVVASQVHAK
jgi:hypothetical protein